MEKDFYTVKEFAQEFGFSTDRVYEALRMGKINHYERLTPHSIYRIPKTEFGRLKREPHKLSAQELEVSERIKQVQPIITKALEEHRLLMANIAKALLSGNLDNVVAKSTKKGDQFDIFEYSIWEGGYGYGITRKDLINMLERNIEPFTEQPGDFYDMDCFLSHLVAEYPKVASVGFSNFVRENPYELVEILKLLVRRKTFKGTCPVCKDW